MGDSMFNRFTVSAWGDEKVLEMGDGGGCTTMWMFLILLNYSFKSESNDKFYVIYIFPHFFKL